MQCSTAAFRINSSTQAAYTKSQIGSNCSEDYIGIEGIKLIFGQNNVYNIFMTIVLFKVPLNLELVMQTAFIVEDF